MTEVILVQPKTGSWDIMGARLPHSLLSIAALPSRYRFDIKIIDQRVEPDWKEKLLKELKTKPLCVGLSVMSGIQIKYALEISKLVKENSNAKVIWGGYHPTLLPEQTIQNDLIDILILGEGETTFLGLITALKNNTPLDKINGIMLKCGPTQTRTLISNLDEIPDIPYHLVDINKYYGANIGEGQSISMITSRGCPYKCGFCSDAAFHHQKWRGNSSKVVLDRIKYIIDNFGIRNIFFMDDNFCVNLNRFKEIVEGMIPLNVKWGMIGVRVDSIEKWDDELLENVYKSGCKNMDIGIESGSPRMLEVMRKGETVEQMIDINRKLAKYPIIVKYSFICGYPTETIKEMKMSINFAWQLIKDNPNAFTPFFIATPFPGTNMFELVKKHDMPLSLEDWANQDESESNTKSHPWLTKQQINMCNNIALSSYFLNKNIYVRFDKRYLRLLTRLYAPFARFRFKHNFYHLHIEKYLARYFQK